MTRTTAAYAHRAAEYVDTLGSVGAMHRADRHLIEAWGAAASGRLIDAGCGPGHWTQHLAERGAEIRGIDLVPEFIDHARATHPGVRFDVESIEAIDEPDAAIGGILAWFSTIHHEPEAIAVPLTEFARVLRPGGSLLLGCFDADETEAFDHAVVRAYRWNTRDLQRILESAGFDVVAVHRRAERGARAVAAIIAERRS
ncbi:Methyltransferase domain-containing protein [Microbacterium sp. LKL04]|uniref:class I SAM-dependent methyltransferase n=1 Tax=Microbacterium sp. LKL04 TaxID=912630 RepID=UPI000875DE27|nr:class I SAM-dependent methyltransferase [Microbacterium sp. LKL04]SCY63741.1 Methyltransferase domain-containing protein [Microbacterium sp. LKL04]